MKKKIIILCLHYFDYKFFKKRCTFLALFSHMLPFSGHLSVLMGGSCYAFAQHMPCFSPQTIIQELFSGIVSFRIWTKSLVICAQIFVNLIKVFYQGSAACGPCWMCVFLWMSATPYAKQPSGLAIKLLFIWMYLSQTHDYSVCKVRSLC